MARFSYRVGLSNDNLTHFQFIYPAVYEIDNRPSVLYTNVAPIDANSNLDLASANNVLYKYNSVEGGVIVPRGCSVVGSDLRRTKIIPKYVPHLQHLLLRVLIQKSKFPHTSNLQSNWCTYLAILIL